MITKVEKFKTEDGKLFNDELIARRHSEMFNEAAFILKHIGMPKNSPGCSWENGGGYYQLSETQVAIFISAFQSLVLKYHPDIDMRHLENPKGILGRILCDYDSPLSRVYNALSQIDYNNRLWGQPYFALHPWEGQQVNLSEVKE